jgi:hypothetical protein
MPNTRNPKLNIYLLSNIKTLALLDRTQILPTLQEAITKLLGKLSPHSSLNLHRKDPNHIDNNNSYTNPYPDLPQPNQNPKRLSIRSFHAAWNLGSFIYTNG